jgi:hypothetical protein
MMTVGELKAMLEGLDDEAVVRIAKQPNYPIIVEVKGVNQDVCEPLDGHEPYQVVYLLEGDDFGYGSSDLWNV